MGDTLCLPKQILGTEDPMEKEMAAHYSLLVWEIPWSEEPGGLQTVGFQKSRTGLRTKQQQHQLKILFMREMRMDLMGINDECL